MRLLLFLPQKFYGTRSNQNHSCGVYFFSGYVTLAFLIAPLIFRLMLRIFRPHYRLESVTQLTVEQLGQWNLRSLLLDVDSTLKKYGAAELSQEVSDWLEELKSHQIGLCIVSNGAARRIGPFAESIGLPFIAPAMKPLAVGCRKAMRQQNFDPKTTAMVGDQIFADIAAARLAGITAILIKPISPELEPLWTRVKRPFEKMVNRD